MDLNQTQQLLQYAGDYGTTILFSLAIFFVGRWLVTRIVGLIERALLKKANDETLTKFLCSIMRWVGLLFVVIAALDQLGVNTTSLVALLGAAGLAIGLSLQNSLGNFAAGVMLIVFKPFKKGDFVEAGGAMGTVDSIHIFTTTMTTSDNKEIIIPNGSVIASNITNFSARATRRVDMVFGISYDDDIRKAKSILESIVAEDKRVLAEPAPVIQVSELAESSVNFIVRPWVNAENYWPVLWDTTEAVKYRFDDEGISFPFRQTDVHLHNVER